MRKKRAEMGKQAWETRKKYGYSWSVIGRMMNQEQGTIRKAAEHWAAENHKEWPLEYYSRGKMLYEMLEEGWTLIQIRNETGIEVYNARKYARDYARRNKKEWPVK